MSENVGPGTLRVSSNSPSLQRELQAPFHHHFFVFSVIAYLCGRTPTNIGYVSSSPSRSRPDRIDGNALLKDKGGLSQGLLKLSPFYKEETRPFVGIYRSIRFSQMPRRVESPRNTSMYSIAFKATMVTRARSSKQNCVR